MKRYDLENYEDSLSIMDVTPDGEWVDYDDAVEAIQQARREGWEQAKQTIEYYLRNEERSAALLQQIAYIRYIADAIAAMEYGENK